MHIITYTYTLHCKCAGKLIELPVASQVGYWMDAIVLPHIVIAKQWPQVELNERVIIVFSRVTKLFINQIHGVTSSHCLVCPDQ